MESSALDVLLRHFLMQVLLRTSLTNKPLQCAAFRKSVRHDCLSAQQRDADSAIRASHIALGDAGHICDRRPGLLPAGGT